MHFLYNTSVEKRKANTFKKVPRFISGNLVRQLTKKMSSVFLPLPQWYTKQYTEKSVGGSSLSSER